MAIAVACHVEPIVESEVMSVVATCWRVWAEWLKLGWDVWMEQTGSLSQQSKSGSDIFEVADESTVVKCLGR